MQEFVVPRSIPIVLAMLLVPFIRNLSEVLADRRSPVTRSRPYGQSDSSGHSGQPGFRAVQVRRPCRISETWSSYASSANRSISSWASSNVAPGRNSPRRVPTRKTCVSTGTSGRPYENSRTHAAVLRPTPGSEHRYSRPPRPGAVSSHARSSPSSARRIFWITLRLRGRQAAGPDRLLDLLLGRVAHGLPDGNRSRRRP